MATIESAYRYLKRGVECAMQGFIETVVAIPSTQGVTADMLAKTPAIVIQGPDVKKSIDDYTIKSTLSHQNESGINVYRQVRHTTRLDQIGRAHV